MTPRGPTLTTLLINIDLTLLADLMSQLCSCHTPQKNRFIIVEIFSTLPLRNQAANKTPGTAPAEDQSKRIFHSSPSWQSDDNGRQCYIAYSESPCCHSMALLNMTPCLVHRVDHRALADNHFSATSLYSICSYTLLPWYFSDIVHL